jgi:hypothetical protein
MKIPSGVATNIRNASQSRLCVTAGQKNWYVPSNRSS